MNKTARQADPFLTPTRKEKKKYGKIGRKIYLPLFLPFHTNNGRGRKDGKRK